VAKGELYISGQIQTINGDSIWHIAHWNGGDYVQECGPAEVAVMSISQAEPLLLYPNPVDDYLSIRCAGLLSLNIYDATGKLIKTVSPAELKSGINVSYWPSGMYFAKAVLNNGAVLNSKFLKQH
jgi:hypothetical protein